jgi:hypothetical protein
MNEQQLTWEEWMKEAHDAGAYYWAYRELVMDNPYGAEEAFKAGMDPREYIKSEGERLDLHEFGPAFGSW